MYLLDKLEALWGEENYQSLRKVCIRDTWIPESLRKNIKLAPNLEEVFNLLKESPYLTWFEIRILQRIAKMVENSEAKCLLTIYEKYAFSKRCSEVQQHFLKQYVIPEYLTQVTTKLNANLEKVLVSDMIKYCNKLGSIVEAPTESVALINCKSGCVEIHMVILTSYSYYAYSKAKSMLLKLRQLNVQYLQIGSLDKLYPNRLTLDERSQLLLKEFQAAAAALHCKLCMLNVYTLLNT